MEIHLDRSQSPHPFDEPENPQELSCLEQLCLTIYKIWEAFCAWIGNFFTAQLELPLEFPREREFQVNRHTKNLPPKLWAAVFRHLSIDDYGKARLTCKGMWISFEKLIEKESQVNLEHIGRLRSIPPQLQNPRILPHIRVLSCTRYAGKHRDFALLCPNLKEVNCQSKEIPFDLPQEGLVFNMSQPINFWYEQSYLRSNLRTPLIIDHRSRSSIKELSKLPLTEVITVGHSNLDQGGSSFFQIIPEIWKAVLNMPNLRELYLNKIGLSNDILIADEIWEQAKELRTLHVSVESEALLTISTLFKCSKLTSLSVKFNSYKHNTTLVESIGKCRNLKHLEFPLFYTSSLEPLFRCTQLQYLTLDLSTWGPSYFSHLKLENSIEMLAQNLPRLKELIFIKTGCLQDHQRQTLSHLSQSIKNRFNTIQ